VRITGGEWRSRRLRGPGKTVPLRPTPDSMRERAFAVLGDRVTDASFLDLYAGTGAVGRDTAPPHTSSRRTLRRLISPPIVPI